MRKLVATFADGFQAPVVPRGQYPTAASHILIGLTHNAKGYARVLFIHDSEPIGAKTLEAHDPWIEGVSEHVRLT